MVTPRFLRLAGAAAGALVLGGAVVAVTASAAGLPVVPFAATNPTPKAAATARPQGQACTNFVNHLANNLGKKPADVQTATRNALAQTVDDAVKSGQTTPQQGDALKKKLASNAELCPGAVSGIGRAAPGPGARPHLMADVANALGLSPADLTAQLKAGKSVKDIAAGKGLDETAFRSKFIAAVKADLDAQVAGGKLTAQQEQMALTKLQTAALPDWNHGPRAPRAPKATPTPTP
jgi:hypothetical protein